MPIRPKSVILLVVGTLAMVVALYAATLAACALRGIPVPQDIMSAFKDFALVALGGLTGLLARTSTGETPSQVTVTNTEANPVPTDAQ